MNTMAMTESHLAEPTLSQEHSVLLWQTCAYATDLIDAARCGRPLSSAHNAMLEFAHYGLLPYLTEEERRLPPNRLRDDHLTKVLLHDHARIRSGVDNIEAGHSRQLLALAADALVDRLDRHVRREESWVSHDGQILSDPALIQSWALPLLLCDDIDLDAIPEKGRERLVMQRLAWMRPGDTLHLGSSRDLHSLWRRHHRQDPDSHAWVYEDEGPRRWRVRVTRRTPRTP